MERAILDIKNRDRCFVIAEAGTAHADEIGMRLSKAIHLVDQAALVGVDAIKFQWFFNPTPETMFCWIDGDEVRAPRWQASYMPCEDWGKVRDHALECGIILLASCFEQETVNWLNYLDIQATKVASRAAKSFPYDKAPKPYLVSNGMGLPSFLPLQAHIIQCEARYPSSSRWDEKHIGFSDHSGAPFLGIDAISRGCKLLEVHFMVDPTGAGPDLPACLTLDELRLVCEARDYYAKRKAA